MEGIVYRLRNLTPSSYNILPELELWKVWQTDYTDLQQATGRTEGGWEGERRRCCRTVHSHSQSSMTSGRIASTQRSGNNGGPSCCHTGPESYPRSIYCRQDRTVPLPLSFLWSLFCCECCDTLQLQLQSTPLAFTSVFPTQ